MKRDFNPVDVELSIENPSIERSAFYRLCFITESDIAPRTLKVTRLQDLLENGYSRLDLAYNFCVGVFSQQGIDTVYIRAKRSFESYVEAYNSDDNSMYYFVVLQTKDLTEIEKFNSHLVSSDEMKLQFFSQNVGSKILQSPKLVNYYQDYTRPEGGVSSGDRDYYLNKAYEGSDAWVKIPLPDYLLEGYGDDAVDYGVGMMVGKDYLWEIDKPNRQIRYARSVVESGWVGSREESTVNNSEVTVVATKGKGGKLLRAIIKDPKVKIETISRELLKGLGKEVLDYAIPLIDPEAKDWVLDLANNRVGYTVPSTESGIGTGADAKNYECYYKGKDQNLNTVLYYVNQNTGGAVFVPSESGQSGRIVRGDTVVVSSCKRLSDAPPVPSPVETEKSIPIDTVSQQVITNADAGHLESKEFLKSIPLFAYLLTGSGTEAVNKAVLDIDPEATDWVLDPANNRIKYNVTSSGVWTGSSNTSGSTAEAACRSYVSSRSKFHSVVMNSETSATCWFVSLSGGDPYPNFDVSLSGSTSSEEKYLPIDVVAAKVISNAEAGHAPSQEAVKATALEGFAAGEHDAALDAAAVIDN